MNRTINKMQNQKHSRVNNGVTHTQAVYQHIKLNQIINNSQSLK